MPKEQTAFDPRSFEDEEDYRRAEMGAGASRNDAVDNDAEAKQLSRDGKLPPAGKFNETYDSGARPGPSTNTKV
jgi:hypothetical protein